jgi:signal transduction histidine kinase
VGSAIRALIVEDCDDDALLMIRQLGDSGMAVAHQRVETAAELARALYDQEWDVLLVDWKLPGFDGWEALRLLQESDRDIPFIIVSGVSGEEAAVAAMKAGAHDVVSKDKLGRLAPAIARELREAATRTARREAEASLRRSHQELEVANRSLMDADRHKDEFLAVISHELRTPLNFITAFASLMADDEVERLQTNQRLYLSKIEHGAERMLHLVNNLLDMSRIQAGRLSIVREELDLGMVIHDVLQSLKPLSDSKGLAVEMNVDVPEAVFLDGARIFQVVANLVSNAIKFTPEGGKIEVEARLEHDIALLSVTDTGPGIAEEDMTRLFQPFTQLDMSYTRKDGGAGLGLSICQALVVAHGGTIGLTSRMGEGSRFWMTLPAGRTTVRPDAPPTSVGR